MKYLYVEFSDGITYKIPCDIIAESRALYYAVEIDKFEKGSKEYQDEYTFSLENDDELLDWAHNNMNWVDVEQYREYVSCKEKTNYNTEWSNVPKEIKEK